MAHHVYGHPYDPNCPHCRPALIDPETGTPYGDDHPAMKIVLQVWSTAPFEQRRAFIAVTADSSRDLRDLSAMEPLLKRMQDAMKNAGSN